MAFRGPLSTADPGLGGDGPSVREALDTHGEISLPRQRASR
jgi:hypothetical protein